MVLAFLRAERYKFSEPGALAIIDKADTQKPLENHQRLRLLFQIRGALLIEIPPDTLWFEVDALTDAELDEIHVISRFAWDDPVDKNELRNVARRQPETLKTDPSRWPKPIFWGHGKAGPFTIIEGNHRLIAYACDVRHAALSIPVIVGLSPTYSLWHFADPPVMIANDLWRR